MGKLTDKVAKGVFWVLMEKFGIQAVHFVVTLVLARLLTPNDYGTVALLSIFITISNVFVDCGFGKALVQKKTATQVDYNSVFYLSMAIAAVLYAGLFFSAPWIAGFYRIPELKVMLRVLALSLIFHSVNGVQNVELNRKMLFHLSFRISWVSVLVKAVVGVAMAYCGYGPWALVWASIAGGVAGVISRQFVIAWRPTLSFSWTSVKELFRFGWKVTATSIFNQAYADLQGLLIGRIYTRADLAFVNKGRHVPVLISGLVQGSLTRVSFSALSKLQDNPERMRNAMRRMIRTTTFLIYPMMVVLGLLAAPIVELLYGEKWLPAVPFLQVTCFAALLRPFDTVNMQAIMARGRSDLYLKLMIVRRMIGLVILLSTIKLGVFVFVAAATFTVVPLGVIINTLPNSRHLGYTLRMQFSDVAESFGLVAFCGVLLFASTFLPVGRLALLPIQVVAFGLLYFGLALRLRMSPMIEIAKAISPVLSKRLGEDSAIVRFLNSFLKGGAK